jgi:hypothetical protein
LSGSEISSYCHDVEAYLCQKNDGHLIRVVGPSFEVVTGWAAAGVPLKVAFAGIDRYFERYYRKGVRRRPVRIDFCDADVLDMFDEWRRALGLAADRASESPLPASDDDRHPEGRSRSPSLPSHLERVLLRLTGARAQDRLGPESDALLDRVSQELDAARAAAGGLRGSARAALIGRLAALDGEMLKAVRASLDELTRTDLARQADDQLAGFSQTMTPDRLERVREAAIDRLARERFGLPVLSFE